jgi:hypothetical protein
MSEASATPWQNPAHAADRSNAAAGVHPSRSASTAAADGVCRYQVTVETMTASTSPG